MRRCCWFLVFGALLCSGGCAAEHELHISPQQRKAKAIRAYDSALAAIMREPSLNLDVLWLLREILKLTPDSRLEQFVNDRLARVKKHHSLRLLDPNAPYNDLPENSPSGIARFSIYLRAPFGRPRERAISLISDFMASRGTGYVLTHQFYVLEWAKQTGLKLPKQLTDKRPNILKQILREQLKDESFSDLYAERAATLLHFAKPKTEDAAKWIDTIIKAQFVDGNWPVYSTFLSYDGQTAINTPPASHTTVLSLFALRAYINEY